MSATPVSLISPSRRFRVHAAVSGHVLRQDVVADRLLDYLRIPGLRYRTRPTPLTGGWETYTYGMELEPAPGLPARLLGPLVLRIYSSERAVPRARREFAVQSFINSRGFPSARPLLAVEDDEPFGGPFLLMERVPGRSLLQVLEARPWRLWDLPGRMAELHARLHQLSPAGFPDASDDLLGRTLEEIRARIVTYGLEGLWPGYHWLAANRPHRTGTPRPLHLDWHPLNLVYSSAGLVALDWTEADVGDRHADVATTLLEILCLPAPSAGWQRPFLRVARGILARRYLRAYRRRLPLDDVRLTYYGAWAALGRLARYGRWLSVGPGNTGCKPLAFRNAGPAQCEALCSYFARHSGVGVRLEGENC
jgi:aminoglycoside phosphotransferase (APT) family kinase protein